MQARKNDTLIKPSYIIKAVVSGARPERSLPKKNSPSLPSMVPVKPSAKQSAAEVARVHLLSAEI
jgi:hypothetical protein